MRRYVNVVYFVGFVMAVWAIYLGIDIVFYLEDKHPAKGDAAVVLGAGVDGNRPSPVFEQRIRHAVDLYHKGRVKKIIFTGGKGPGERFSEAEVGRNYALDAGVSIADIFMERQSSSTLQNLAYATSLVKTNDINTLLIVSDPLHMKRAVSIAQDLGLNAYPSPTQTSRIQSLTNKAVFLAREVYFYQKYLILGS